MKREEDKKMHRVLARKWRPITFSDVVGQQHVLTPLVNSIRLKKLHHSYLLTGTRGVGKTSLARILAKAICCQARKDSEPCGSCSSCTQIAENRYIDLIEVDAASRSKVEETRDLIENLHYSPATGNSRVYIIDEVHMFSRHSFNSLLKVLEEPPSHVTFILATTDYKKIPGTILSRCLQFHLKHLSVSQISGRLSYILEQESVEAQEQALTDIARAARGSMRDALSLLDQAIGCGLGKVDLESTRSMLGAFSADQAWELVSHLADSDLGAVIASVDRYAEQVIDCAQLLDQIISVVQNLALVKSYPPLNTQEAFRAQAGEYDFVSLGNKFSVEDLHLFEHIATDARSRLWISPSPERALKICFARMLVFAGSDGGGRGAGSSGGKADGETPSAPVLNKASSEPAARAGKQNQSVATPARPPDAAPTSNRASSDASAKTAPKHTGDIQAQPAEAKTTPEHTGDNVPAQMVGAVAIEASGNVPAPEPVVGVPTRHTDDNRRAQPAVAKTAPDSSGLHAQVPAPAAPTTGSGEAMNSRSNTTNRPDLLRDLRSPASVNVSEAMQTWRDIVDAVENDGLTPDATHSLRQSVELVRTGDDGEPGDQWQLRRLKKGFRNQAAQDGLNQALAELKRRDIGVQEEEVDNITVSLNLIDSTKKDQTDYDALSQYARDPVVAFLRNHLRTRLVSFDHVDQGDHGQSRQASAQ